MAPLQNASRVAGSRRRPRLAFVPGALRIQSLRMASDVHAQPKGFNCFKESPYPCQAAPMAIGATSTRRPRMVANSDRRGFRRYCTPHHRQPRPTKPATAGGFIAYAVAPAATASTASTARPREKKRAAQVRNTSEEEQCRRLDHEGPGPEQVDGTGQPQGDDQQPVHPPQAELRQEKEGDPETCIEKRQRDGPARCLEPQPGGSAQAGDGELVDRELVRQGPRRTQDGRLVGEPGTTLLNEVGADGRLRLPPPVVVGDGVRPAPRSHGEAPDQRGSEDDGDDPILAGFVVHPTTQDAAMVLDLAPDGRRFRSDR